MVTNRESDAGCVPAKSKSQTRTPLLDKLEEIFEKNPELIEKIVQAAVMKAVEGDFRYFCEIRDMLDGKPVQEHCAPNGELIPVKLITAEHRAEAGSADIKTWVV